MPRVEDHLTPTDGNTWREMLNRAAKKIGRALALPKLVI
jgi:hypothetical protein